MNLEIITPDKKIFKGSVKLIKVPGSKGSFEILPKHAPIVSTLEKSEIKVVIPNGEELFFNINGGVIESKQDNVIILAEK
ncbi:MAG: ATP synthase F1 subunit epsilon [Bacteroidetes bacterium]|jgi:F-type H+-transporting ATPase subunit epsilon|nr:ATP synthase F1 subunit epsilon [Bacteroidota bacterium]MBT6687365.1 ATP synthase F1 subunit epsilon [Bacteroidota bacterium]MBT7143916.1 ATP synthase F1 subunit epsilon [Bacteroidota bacterium]MBT7492420.1 ATP synthase F1 subunit epsilon [Bacteroidota bacterium]